jgi:pyrroline-5-carboxylate reductase
MKLTFIGGGNMGEAMLAAVIRDKVSTPNAIAVSDISEPRRKYLNDKYRIAVFAENLQPACQSEVLVLAVKPQQISVVMRDLYHQLKDPQLVISIAAGINIDALCRGLDYKRIVRAMPNTPAQVGAGISVWAATPYVSEDDKVRARSILGAMGKQIYVGDENYLDMATAVSGSGPAYVFLFVEALTAAAIDLGLSDEMAKELAMETVLGSARYMLMSDKSPTELRQMVTSPGGTTAAALDCLEKGGFAVLIKRAVRAAFEKAKELGKL